MTDHEDCFWHNREKRREKTPYHGADPGRSPMATPAAATLGRAAWPVEEAVEEEEKYHPVALVLQLRPWTWR